MELRGMRKVTDEMGRSNIPIRAFAVSPITSSPTAPTSFNGDSHQMLASSQDAIDRK